MTTTEILTGIKNWVSSKLNLKQDVINDLAAIRSGSQAGSTAVQPSDLSSYFNNASYDTSTHRINFYHGQNIVAYVDASPFIVDGMVDDVRIENGYLVIDFNTDSGKQDIRIPLTDIFDPSNYYNKTQTDTLLGNKVDKVSGKGLSTNDYTNVEKEKLSGLQNYDDTQVRQLIGQKQDVIQDLADIRSGASAGSTAVQPSTLNNVVKNVVAESGVYDVSANNDNTKFESLSALLSSANLNTLIPTDIRKGGMSIKFVLSSDNKYVQYRLMANAWSTDTEDWAIADEGVYVENPEFVYVQTDKDDKILWAIKTDGGIYYGAGVPQQVVDYINERIAGFSPDKYENIVDFLNGLEEGDKTLQHLLNSKLDAEGLDSNALSTQSTIDNPEFIQVTTDSEDKILQSRNPEGVNKEYVGIETPKVNIDGATIENIQDPEGRTEIKTDSEKKILSYRDSEGVMHENVGIESANLSTNSLNLTADGMTEFQKQLKKNGFVATRNDYSEADLVHIPKPKMAFVNIICEQLPTSKEVEYEGYFEYSDTYGNYFKKPIEALSGQGRTSILFPKKNYGFDFADGSKIKFGDWVEQDSFHLKANYIDCFRGARLMIGYHMSAQIMNTYTYEKARPWRYLFANNTTINGATGKIADDLSNEALGVPDGFPFRLYHNGTYIGLYNLQLKKHRDNYQMGKSKAKNIHIDGEQYDNSLFNGSANIDWTLFEVRNPKGLKDINGKKYDGDNPKELSDTDALSAEVKGYIEDFSNKASAITTKQEFEEVIDVDYAIDYVLLMNFLMNLDVINNNTQWCTWDGEKWFPLNYDNDQCFGLTSLGNEIRTTENQRPDDCILGVNFQTGTPLSLLYTMYKERMELRYKELVDTGILTVKNVIDQLTEWCDNIGKAYYDEEFALWPETPSYRESNSYPNFPQTGGLYDSIERVEKYMIVRKLFLDTYFNYN